jgi:hypothetical protein
VALVAPVVEAVTPPGDDVTVYPVMALPPFDAGGDQVTVAEALPPVALADVGAPGLVKGVTAFDAADGGLDPCAFWAVTVNVYVEPFVRPLTVAEVADALRSAP